MSDEAVLDSTDKKPEAQQPSGDAAHWQAEAKKAFDARQAAKKEADDLRKRLDAYSDIDPDEYKTLKAQQNKAEEDRKRKEGEFDTWRADILKKHQSEIETAQQARQAAEERYRQKLVGLAFAGASDLFGDNGKTVLTPEIAESYFGKYVEVQTDEAGNDRVVVKDKDGHTVIDAKTGKPATFVDAMKDIIDALPNRDRILRGSGKVGSGSPGGGTGGTGLPVSLTNLTPTQLRDPKILEALKAQRGSGGVVMGTAFQR